MEINMYQHFLEGYTRNLNLVVCNYERERWFLIHKLSEVFFPCVCITVGVYIGYLYRENQREIFDMHSTEKKAIIICFLKNYKRYLNNLK